MGRSNAIVRPGFAMHAISQAIVEDSGLRRAQAAMTHRDTNVSDLCAELGITRNTLYRLVSPKGELRPDGEKLLKMAGK